MSDFSIAESVLFMNFRDENQTITAKDALNADGFINGVRITGRGELTISHETTFINSGPHSEIDPEWSHVDSAGHFHARDKEGNTPTLVWKHSDPYWCDTCNDEHTDDWQECMMCCETIKPGYRPVSSRRMPVSTSRSTRLAFSIFDPKRNDIERLKQTGGTNLQEMTSLHIVGDGVDLFGFVRLGPMELLVSEAIRLDCVATGQLHSRR